MRQRLVGLAEPGGRNALFVTLALLLRGFPPQAVIEALIVGLMFEESVEVRGGCWAEAIKVGGTIYLSDNCRGLNPEPTDGSIQTDNQVELIGAFTMATGSLEQIVTNELRVTVTADGRVSGEGTIITRLTGTVESSNCYYDYEWQADFVVAGSLTDTVGDNGGTRADLQLTSEQRHNYNRSDEECPVRIVDPTGNTAATAELILSEPATMTAMIEPARPSPFVKISSFEVVEQ